MNKDWQKVKVGDLCNIKHGYAFKGEYFSDKGKYILLTPGNFTEREGLVLKTEKEKYYTGNFPKEYVLSLGDMLLVLTDLKQDAPYLGAPGIVKISNKLLHNQRLGLVKNINVELVDETFLYWIFQSDEYRSQIKGSATGSTVRHTAPERIYSCQVCIPKNKNTQRRIAAILSAYDKLIENNSRRIKILEEMARMIYQEWFVKFRFPGHEQAKFVESPLGMIPAGWEVKKLIEICSLTMGQSPESKFYNEIGEGLPFHQGVTDFGEHFPTTRVYCTVRNRIAKAGDILFSVRAPVGRINITDQEIIIGRGLSAIYSKHNHQAFIYNQLKEKFFEEDMIGGGTIFKSVTKSDLENIKILYPEEKYIKMFESNCIAIQSQIRVLTKKNNNLRQTRDMLLPKLISGEIDVSDLDIPIEER